MLHTLKPANGSRKSKKRIARGNSANGGTTAGRGTKGQQSRTGKGKRHGFEGGQVPLIRRQPKLGGFRNPKRIEYDIINLSTLDALEPGSYTLADLVDHRLTSGSKPVKVLGHGTLTKKVSVQANAASKSAKEAVQKAGGEVSIVK